MERYILANLERVFGGVNYMSEEEIIKKLERYINGKDTMKETLVKAIQGLLDLYQREKESDTKHLAEIGQLRTELCAEKEKNKELIEGQVETLEKILQPQLLKKYVSKDKIKEKLEEINKEYFKKLSKQKNLMEQNILGCQRYAMENILRELLEG